MAQNTPWRLKNSNIFWGDPPGGGAPPSHLALHEKMAAVPPSLVPAINTFVPGTSNLNKNPAFSGRKSIFLCMENVQITPCAFVCEREES